MITWSAVFRWLKALFGGASKNLAAHGQRLAPTTAMPDDTDRLAADDWFTPALREVIQEAQLDIAAVWPHRHTLRSVLNASESRGLDRALRALLPAQIWSWPGYEKWAALVGEKPTRLRMVAAAANMLTRKVSMQERMAQMLLNVDRRPHWQLRAAGDSNDWPACAKLSGRIERWNSRFWQTRGPHQCSRVGCRCTIRAYSELDLRELRR